MATLKSTTTLVQHVQHERFTREQHDCHLFYLSLSLSGNIAVSGYHNDTDRTFVDLYFGRNSDSRDKLKLFYSKEFEKYSYYWARYVSFLEKTGTELMLTCIGDKIEIIDTTNESKVLRSCKLNGDTRCLAVREGEIFIGLYKSQTVIVFNNDLKETKRIILKGIQTGDIPWDLQVIKDAMFVSTADKYGYCRRAYSISESDHSVITQYTDTTGKYSKAVSLTVSEILGLVAVLWSGSPSRRIIVYSLNENKSFLVFEVNSDVDRIRISDKDRMIITGNHKTGEIKMYELEQLFSFEAMKRSLAYIVSPDECEELSKDFEITEDELITRGVGHVDKSMKLSEKEKTMRKMECLLIIIEEKGHLNPYNINHLKDAVSTLGDELHVSNLTGPMEGYVLLGMMAEMMNRQKTLEDERNQLSSKLETAESKVKEHEKTFDDLQGKLVHVEKKFKEQEETFGTSITESTKEIERLTDQLEESTRKIAALTDEIARIKTEFTKDKQTLTEEVKRTKQLLELTEIKYTRNIETLTEELELTKIKFANETEKLTEQLEQYKQSKNESFRQIETMTERLEQMRRESAQAVGRLTVEITQTRQSADLSKTESTIEIETLKLEQKEMKQKLVTKIKELGTANKDLMVTKQVLQETKQDRGITRTELKQYQLDFAKESKAVKEVLNQTKEVMAEIQERAVEDKPPGDLEETIVEGALIRAAEFGRVTVAIAEHLTLDHCLKLARVFNIPVSDCDTVLRVSLFESPGIKFLDVLKKRNVINMFDVTNLQKGLTMLHLEAVNHDLVGPYQDRVDKEQYELYKVEEMYTWKEVNAFVYAVKEDTARRQLRESQTSPEDDTKPGITSQREPIAQQSETGELDRKSLLRGRHQLYIEHIIGRGGGTIQLANVSLTVPSDALHENHMIALCVMNESPFPLVREVATARMTPLIKLEPLGLMFKKSLQLKLPHSALIPEPENHDVIIYSGQMSKNIEDSLDSITWTEERSIPRQLKEKSVTVHIQCLSYLSASLVSQTTVPPLYIVRALPFVDGVRYADDNITLTICFCSDNDPEYNMLLSDYKTKLPLEQYSTLQLRRHSERDEDDAMFLSVTVTSVNNTYIPDAEQAVKRFAVSHLCTASRVSHQLRLKKNQDTDRDVVDILLKFSQAQYEPTKISLKARIKDLIVSEESEKFLTGSLPPGNKTYEDMVINISSILDTEQCRELATYFQLTLKETEIITSNHNPGKMLMKTLEERSVIDSQNMILFIEGLKTCHRDEIAKLVSEYTNEISKQTQEKEQKPEEHKQIEETEECTLVAQYTQKKDQRTARSSLRDQSVQTTLSSSCVSSVVHVKTLTKEGYTEQEVVDVLDISRNRLVMARRILQCIGEQFGDVPPTKDYIYLHKEQYIDENGGEITLREANVYLLIPVGAVTKGSIVSLTMMTSKQGNVPYDGRTPQLSPVIKLGPEIATLNKPVTIRIPHCASEMDGITSADIYLGFSSNGEDIQWRQGKNHEPKPTLEESHFEVSVQTCCAISMNIAVDFRKSLSKKFRVLPLISRIVNPTDDLTVTLWIYNDDEAEHMHLLHEEINIRGKIQLHDFKRFTLKGSEREKEVYIKRESNKITSHAGGNMKKVPSTTLWYNARHAVEFHFKNREGIGDISFRLTVCPRQLLRIVVDLRFDLKVALSELLQKSKESTRALLKTQESHPAMEKSFQELVSKLSGQLDLECCLEIAGIFRLSSDLKDRVKKSNEPGKVIFDELIHEQLITAASVSALDVALTGIGKVQLAEDVKVYRHRNATFPTTIFTLL